MMHKYKKCSSDLYRKLDVMEKGACIFEEDDNITEDELFRLAMLQQAKNIKIIKSCCVLFVVFTIVCITIQTLAILFL